MLFPVVVENFQVKYFNPMIKPFARFMPGMATIKHRGRKSGKTYETIVTAFRKDKVLAIALGHGKTDWVKNVLAAGEADVHFIRRDVHLVNPRIVPAGSGAEGLPFMVRLQANRVGVFVADIA
jgi:deazaflavin-dependent oxidoreductase (nitroreductase family)